MKNQNKYTPTQRAEILSKWRAMCNRGMVQEAAAHELGVPLSTVNNWAVRGVGDRLKPSALRAEIIDWLEKYKTKRKVIARFSGQIGANEMRAIEAAKELRDKGLVGMDAAMRGDEIVVCVVRT